MGVYLNSSNAFTLYKNETLKPYFVDKSLILRELIPLVRDLKYAYPEIEYEPGEAVWDVLKDIHEFGGREKFVFILDEWDYVFHQDYMKDEDKQEYLSFLRNLLKDKPYASMAYMTGILPIAKYASGSELNMFLEYTMATEERFGEYFGFRNRKWICSFMTVI